MSNSSSKTQEWAEGRLIKYYNLLMRSKGIYVKPEKLTLSNKTTVALDGYDESNGYAVEVYTHIGKLKGSQSQKLATDILKLSLLDVPHKVIIAHKDIIKWLQGDSWIALAAKEYKIKLVNGYFTAKMIDKLTKAQKLQDISR